MVKPSGEYLRNSRWSSRPAPGWVCVIRSNRRARGTGGGVESIRASALHSSPSLLFCRVERFGSIYKTSSPKYPHLKFNCGLYLSLNTVPVCQSPWQGNVAGGGWNVQNWEVRETPKWRRWWKESCIPSRRCPALPARRVEEVRHQGPRCWPGSQSPLPSSLCSPFPPE